MMYWRTLAALLIATPVVAGADITTLDGKKLTGTVTAIDGRSITLRVSTGDEVTPIAQVLGVEFNPLAVARDKFTEVELTDGSTLACSAVTLKGTNAELVLVGGPTLATPLAAIRTLLNDAHDAAIRQEWTLMLRKRGALDMLVLKSEGKLDALDGAFGAGNPAGDSIDFSPAGADQKLTPRLNRVQGLVFVRRPDPGAAPPFCKVIDAAGNVLTAKAVKIDGDAWVIDLVAGGSVRYSAANQLHRLDFAKGKLTYLSDIDPVERDESSTEDFVFPYRKDRNLYGGPLKLKGVHYPKGIALHSRTALTFDLGGEYNEFRAVIGVDDVVRTENGVPVKANLRIEADGRELLATVVQSKDEPKPLALDVKNVRRLRITVSAPQLDLGNQVNLCEARVTK